MEAKDRLAHVKITMGSGHAHEFTMTVEKSVQFLQVVTFSRRSEGRQWVDIYDYTDAASGQMMVDVGAIETLWVEPRPHFPEKPAMSQTATALADLDHGRN